MILLPAAQVWASFSALSRLRSNWRELVWRPWVPLFLWLSRGSRRSRSPPLHRCQPCLCLAHLVNPSQGKRAGNPQTRPRRHDRRGEIASASRSSPRIYLFTLSLTPSFASSVVPGSLCLPSSSSPSVLLSFSCFFVVSMLAVSVRLFVDFPSTQSWLFLPACWIFSAVSVHRGPLWSLWVCFSSVFECLCEGCPLRDKPIS